MDRNPYKADYPAYRPPRNNPRPRHELEDNRYTISETVTEALKRRKEDE